VVLKNSKTLVSAQPLFVVHKHIILSMKNQP
jgi:hypothetical protein